MSLLKIVEKEGTRLMEIVSPATLERVGELPVARPEAVLAAVEKARRAQPLWAQLPIRERVATLRRTKELLLDRLDEVVEVIHRETGKPRREALAADVVPSLDALDFYAGCAEEILADEKIRFRPRYALLDSRRVFLPLGVVGIISPWNYPLGIPLGEAVAILLAGNAVVVKPSEHTPYTALKMKELFDAAGLPADLLSVVPGDGETGRALAAAPLDKLVFTGSARTGKKVLASAAERLMPVILELGGNDPMVVCADADLGSAVSGALWGRFTNSGQTCAAVKRLYLDERIAVEFTERIVARVGKLRQGIDGDYDAEVGPLISDPQRALLEEQVEEAKAKGARVAAGGERPKDLPGFFYRPTVLLGAEASMRVMREETFGPVMSIQTFRDEAEAVSLANASTYALSASVWSRDLPRAEDLARRLDGGTVWVNNCIYTFGVTETPWGGYKESGMGHTHSADGLREFCKVKHLAVDTLFPAQKPWWYPYPAGRSSYEQDKDLISGLYGRGLGKVIKGVIRVIREARARAKA
jgi:succinate-semialdehyde dehydrogenase/glutarate-semialdehyde dehydrogenase